MAVSTYAKTITSLIEEKKSPLEVQQIYFQAYFYYRIRQFHRAKEKYLILLRNNSEESLSDEQYIELNFCLAKIYQSFSNAIEAEKYFLIASQRVDIPPFAYIKEDKINHAILRSCFSKTHFNIRKNIKNTFSHSTNIFHQDYMFFLLLGTNEFSALKPYWFLYIVNLFYTIEKVHTFQEMLKEIRLEAAEKLKKEVKHLEKNGGIDTQILFLEEAKKLKIFSLHRNPFIFFNNTEAVNGIDRILRQLNDKKTQLTRRRSF